MVSQLKIWKILVLEKVVIFFLEHEHFTYPGRIRCQDVRNGKQSRPNGKKKHADVQEHVIGF
jgi:hypothetical protein